MRPLQLAIGAKFERWTVLGTATARQRGTFVLCRCDCGSERVVRANKLTSGESRSCGRIARERMQRLSGALVRRHGQHQSPVYKVWSAMKARCANPKHPEWSNYGAARIGVAPNTLYNRIQRGWPLDRALTEAAFGGRS